MDIIKMMHCLHVNLFKRINKNNFLGVLWKMLTDRRKVEKIDQVECRAICKNSEMILFNVLTWMYGTMHLSKKNISFTVQVKRTKTF